MQQNLWQKHSLSKARQRNPHLETRTKYPGFSPLPSELQNSSPEHSPLCTVCISRHDSLSSSIPPTRSAAHPGSQPNICFPCSRAALQVMYASVCLHAARASGTAQHHVEEQSRAFKQHASSSGKKRGYKIQAGHGAAAVPAQRTGLGNSSASPSARSRAADLRCSFSNAQHSASSTRKEKV